VFFLEDGLTGMNASGLGDLPINALVFTDSIPLA
jgi:hypothetical protein